MLLGPDSGLKWGSVGPYMKMDKNNYHEFLNHAEKCTSVKEVTSDHEEGRVEPYNPVQKKDKKMDKK